MENGYYVANLEYWEENTVVEIENIGSELHMFTIGDDESYLLTEENKAKRRDSSDEMEVEFIRKIQV